MVTGINSIPARPFLHLHIIVNNQLCSHNQNMRARRVHVTP
jgi:hypothetical protein